MAQTIYEASPNALIPQPERTVATFPSGLVRVDRKYICRTTAAATHRATLAVGNAPPDGQSEPATDGVYIYPDAQETQRGDGFTEFSVSAYGRTRTGLQQIYMETAFIDQDFTTSPIMRIGVYKVNGTAITETVGGLSIEDIDIDESVYTPISIFLYASPSDFLLSITQTNIVSHDMQTRRPVVIGSGPQFIRSTRRTRRYFTAQMTTDGTTVSQTVGFWLDDPQLNIVNVVNFGTWNEVRISTIHLIAPFILV